MSEEGSGVAIASGERDDETIRAGIERWLCARDEPVRVAPLTRPAAGLSSDTCFVDARSENGTHRELVVRLAPVGDGLFASYNLRAQVEVQNALAERGIPTAAPVRFESDPSWLAAPFMVMPRVAGHVLSRSYLRKGWMVEASPAFRRDLVLGFVRTLASLHRLVPTGDQVFGDQVIDASARDAVATAFEGGSEYLDWATGTGAPLGFMNAARQWCADHLPSREGPASVLWGDVQLTNAVFAADGTVAALLDWEMTGFGPPEMDLGWFLALHEMTIEQHGAELEGIPERAEIIATYEADLGHAAQDLQWFEAFALLRSGSIMIRMARILAAQGIDDAWLSTHNPTERALQRVLGRPGT